MSNVGKPSYWNIQKHVDAVEQLIRADDIDLAIQMCDMIPSYYRHPDRYPKELSNIKQVVARQLYDQVEYSNDDEEADCTREFGEAQWSSGYMHPRAEIILKVLKQMWPKTPWIFDLGCSHGNLPLGLMRENLGFTYKGVGLNWRIVQKVKKWCGLHWSDRPVNQQPTILFCSEVLEHASRVEDIATTALKECVDWDVVILSVPLNTLGGGLPDYTNRRLGHVRTFNEHDLYALANKYWPGRKWELTLAESQVIVGRK